MGEIAEMMLDGTLCECCGCFIDDEGIGGFPRYCSSQCARDRGAMPTKQKSKAKQIKSVVNNEAQPLADKLVKRLLSLIDYGTEDAGLTPKRGQSMYAGMQWDLAGAQFSKLEKRGFVECRQPHNMAHKARAVITQAGIEYLESKGKEKCVT